MIDFICSVWLLAVVLAIVAFAVYMAWSEPQILWLYGGVAGLYGTVFAIHRVYRMK